MLKRVMGFLLLGAIVTIAVGLGAGFLGRVQYSFTNNSVVTVHDISYRGLASSSRFIFDNALPTRGVLHDRRGWPLYCLESHTRIQFDGPQPVEQTSAGIILHPSRYQADTLVFPKVVPLKPIRMGVAINTIIYATAFFIFISLFDLSVRIGMRRQLRLQRGLCPACAYPIGTNDVCTECGERVKS